MAELAKDVSEIKARARERAVAFVMSTFTSRSPGQSTCCISLERTKRQTYQKPNVGEVAKLVRELKRLYGEEG